METEGSQVGPDRAAVETLTRWEEQQPAWPHLTLKTARVASGP